MANQQLLQKVNTELISNFQQQLAKPLLTIAYQESKQEKTWWNEGSVSYKLLSAPSLPHLQTSLEEIVDCFYGDYHINWKAVAAFVTTVENKTKEQNISVFHQQLTLLESSYLAIMEGMKTMHANELVLQNLETEELRQKLHTIEEEAQKFKAFQATIIQKNRFLPSQERVDLENIRYKFNLLTKNTHTLEEKLTLAHNTQQELESSLQTLENNYQAIKEELASTIAQYSISCLDLGFAQGEIAGLQTAKQGLLQLNEQSKSDYITELYISTKLAECILKLKTLSDQSEIHFNEIIHELEQELHKSTISLALNENNLRELSRLNLESKIKLQGILFLDSMRIFTPNVFSKCLTSIETTIFISGITKHHTLEKVSWITIILLLVVSLISTSYRCTKFIYNFLKRKLVRKDT